MVAVGDRHRPPRDRGEERRDGSAASASAGTTHSRWRTPSSSVTSTSAGRRGHGSRSGRPAAACVVVQPHDRAGVDARSRGAACSGPPRGPDIVRSCGRTPARPRTARGAAARRTRAGSARRPSRARDRSARRRRSTAADPCATSRPSARPRASAPRAGSGRRARRRAPRSAGRGGRRSPDGAPGAAAPSAARSRRTAARRRAPGRRRRGVVAQRAERADLGHGTSRNGTVAGGSRDTLHRTIATVPAPRTVQLSGAAGRPCSDHRRPEDYRGSPCAVTSSCRSQPRTPAPPRSRPRSGCSWLARATAAPAAAAEGLTMEARLLLGGHARVGLVGRDLGPPQERRPGGQR